MVRRGILYFIQTYSRHSYSKTRDCLGGIMGCICSKGGQDESVDDHDNEKDGDFKGDSDKGSVQLIAPTPTKNDDLLVARLASLRQPSKAGPVSVDTACSPARPDAELVAAGWPSWLVSVAGEAVRGWLPRRVESFDKLEKVGQGTYSSVYKARDLETGKIVAMKKVRFVNMDPESVRFMAREIIILRRLDHPNVMKLVCIVTSRMSSSLYLVFEYMDHDLAGLAATPGIKFTEQQIKCYMQQLFRGLEHCHSRGVLHRDIKGSNLLIDNNGVLKIADFGLATLFKPDQKQPLTSRVVTLWYRAPELLLGATQYGVAIDLWSVGCILAELFAGKPIMPGRTEVEQMHKIFKLCGSPSEEYWQKTRLPHATSFKPQQPYKRCVSDTFRSFPQSALSLVDKLLSLKPDVRGSATSALRSEFFTTEPFPCNPSDLPKYPPSKEQDAKLRNEEAIRKREEAVKGRGAESVRLPELIAQGQSKPGTTLKYDHPSASAIRIDPCKVASQNGFSHSSSMIHPSAVELLNKAGCTRNTRNFRKQNSMKPQAVNTSYKQDDGASNKDQASVYVPKKNRIHCSGPLVPPGGNIEDMLKEHERQIQEAVRKARIEK
ncbi:probable serine/threonine-protein kinase At1g09600 [Hibiscus syriacus]|uniref:probable serine/threonine-protein kinase At1g09600 n=1 Tax=Hibiscus syriacus TaxID=106335 RepID=UPI0019245254|nr:probable serine/threonine-protein kinase At1g09600 [Hibiscus syriacus]